MGKIRILNIEEAIEDNGLKMMAYGFAGSGKTVLCSTTGQSTIILSAEAGLLSLKKVLKEKPALKKLIKVIQIKNIDDLQNALDLFIDSDERICNWICLDSISEIAEVILAEEKLTEKDKRAAYGNLTDRCMDILRKFRDLPEYNVLMTAKMVRSEDENGKNYFGPSFPGKGVAQNIPYMLDEVFVLRVEEQEDENGDLVNTRFLQTVIDSKYYAKDRSGELNDFEKPNIAKIFKKIRGYDETPFDADEDSKEKYSEKIKTIRQNVKDVSAMVDEEEENEEEVLAEETMYFWHSVKDKYIEVEEGDDITDFVNDDVIFAIGEKSFKAKNCKEQMSESEEEENEEEEEKPKTKSTSKTKTKEPEPEEEDEETEEIISEETQYWFHDPSDGFMMTEPDTDISSLVNDPNVTEITEKKYKAGMKALEAAKDEEEEEKPKSSEKHETKLQKAQREMMEKEKQKKRA